MYTQFYISFILVVLIFTTLKLLIRGGINEEEFPTVFPLKSILLGIVVVGFITFFPADYGSDKVRYLELFENLETNTYSKDIGWIYYNKLIKLFFNNSGVFFFITAIFYFSSNYAFLNRLVKKEYVFYLLIATVGALGFFSYGVNTIRAGIGLSFFLLAIVSRKKFLFVLFAIFSVLIHKSMLIPIAAFFITRIYKNTKYYLWGWLAFLIVSIINVNTVSDFLKTTFAESDERVDIYIGVETSELYNAGFRIDFLLYSVLPLLLGTFYIFKLKFNDKFYIHLFNVYVVVNSFWLLLIRIPFTDRFAYLSWFLIPFIVLYPMFKIENLTNRHIKLALGIGGIVLLNFALIFK